MRWRVLVVPALVLAGCGGDDGPRAPAASGGGEWSTIAPAPIEGRISPVAVSTGEELIVWGGSNAGPSPTDGAAYSFADGTWRTVAPSPLSPRFAPLSVWTGEELLIWGGEDETAGSEMRDGAAYDPTSDSWRPLPDLPGTGRTDLTGIAWTGEEVVLAGLDTGEGPRAAVVAVDPASGDVRPLDDLPSTPEELGNRQAIWTGEEVAVVSGPFTDGATATVDVLDPATGTWAEPWTTSVGLVGNTVWSADRLVLLGSPEIALLDLEAREERLVERPRGDPGDWPAVALDGGRVGFAFHWLDVASATWHPTAPPPRQIRNSPAAVGVGDRMVVWGGDGCLDLCASFVDPGEGLVWTAP